MATSVEDVGKHEAPISGEPAISSNINEQSSSMSNELDVTTVSAEEKATAVTDPGNVASEKSEGDTKNDESNANKESDRKEESDKKEENDKKDETEAKKDNAKPELPRTRIGRPNKDDKSDIIDQADWQTMVPEKDFITKYVAVIKDGGDGREQVTLYSPYIQKVFRAVIRYFPEVYVERRSISFSYPYAPFYYYIDKMQEYVEADKDEDAKREDWHDFRKHFYDTDVGPLHDQVRASLDEENVRFDNLWAVFKPGDMLYTLDDFDEAHLFVIGASTFRGRKYGADDFENMIWRGGSASAGSSERFVIDAWTVTWKGSSKVFSRTVKTFTINFFAGTRAVSSFKIYPIQYHQSGDAEAREQLLDGLEQRGRLWAQLVSREPVSKHHDGPAREVNHTFGRLKIEEERINVSNCLQSIV